MSNEPYKSRNAVNIIPEYNIGEKVYDRMPDSGCGMVINIIYSFLTGILQYQVSLGFGQECKWYYDSELSRTKTF